MSKETKHPHHEEVHHEGAEHHVLDEKIIVAPKGSSKARFLMTFLLVIMLLTTFTVGDEVVACFSKGTQRSQVYMSWTDPVAGAKSLKAAEFVNEKQILAKFWAVLAGRTNREHTDEDTASFVLLSNLSEDAGVRVTDSDLKERIQKAFGSSDRYRAALQSVHMTPKDFEDTFRRMLRINRYQLLLAEGVATADPAAVEKMWKGRHQEYAFDYVELPATSVTDEARGRAPATDELKAWFDALPDGDKEKYKTPASVSAELVALPLDGEIKTEQLFAAYPRPADENVDDAAKDFYAGFGYARFRKTNFKPEEIKKIEDLNEPFESVKEIAGRDARIYRSLSAWQADLAAREAKGEKIDLEAEAQKLGLVYHREDNRQAQIDWEKAEGAWAGRYVVDALFSGTAGKVLPAVTVEKKAFVFGRVLAKEEAAYPPFADMESKVRDAWVSKKASELAVAKLESLRDKFGTRPDAADTNAPPFKPEVDAEKFAAAAKEAGFEVKHRDFEEHYEKLPPDRMTPAETFLRNASQLYTLKEGTVDKAGASTDGTIAFLPRVAGIRDPDPSKMSPAEVQSISKQVSDQAMTSFMTNTFQNIDFLKERYALDLEPWHKEKQTQTPN